MKLCSQCEFIYEDDQERCDMDGAELVYEATLQTASQNLLTKPTANLAALRPAAIPAPRSLRLPIAAGVVFVAVIFAAYYFPRLISTRSETRNSQSVQTSLPPAVKAAAPKNNETSVSPASSQSPNTNQSDTPGQSTNSESPSSSLNPGDHQETIATASQSPRTLGAAHAINGTRNTSDSRLTIPRLPQLTTLPRVPPLRRLPSATAEKKKPGSAPATAKQFTSQRQTMKRHETDQRLAVAAPRPVSGNYKPAAGVEKKQSRLGSFLKKTGRILTKPFKS